MGSRLLQTCGYWVRSGPQTSANWWVCVGQLCQPGLCDRGLVSQNSGELSQTSDASPLRKFRPLYCDSCPLKSLWNQNWHFLFFIDYCSYYYEWFISVGHFFKSWAIIILNQNLTMYRSEVAIPLWWLQFDGLSKTSVICVISEFYVLFRGKDDVLDALCECILSRT